VTDSPIGKIALLRRGGSVDDFAKRFMAFSCRDTVITEAHQVQLFLAGLGKPLRNDVALHRPPTLDNAIMLARAYEQRETTPSTPAPHQYSSWRARTNPPGFATGVTPAAFAAASSPLVAKPASSVQRLTPAEVAQRRKDGQCFHCNEFFTNGHKAVCKQLFCIEVIEADDTPADDTDTLVISIHVLTDIRPHARSTMQHYVVINGAQITALMDSGSTHNFVDLDTTERTGLKFGVRAGL
jgi:hypothetical protein